MRLYNIAIIGLGNIGRRHFISLLKSHEDFNFYLFDNKNLSISKTKNLLNSKNSKNVFFEKNIYKINKIIDLLIVSTTSEVRFIVLKTFLKENIVNNVILEKIVTNNISDYKKIMKILGKKKINSYINFPRRLYEVYNYIKDNLNKNSPIHIKFQSENWNMASNVLHFLDLLNFFSKNNKIYLKESNLQNKIIKSKRKNFIEFKGNLLFGDENKNSIFLADQPLISKDEYISIEQKNLKYFVFEKKSTLVSIKNNGKLKLSNKRIRIPYQSDLTKSVVFNIIKNRKVKLPSIYDSYHNHNLIFKIFKKHLNKIKKNNLEFLIT